MKVFIFSLFAIICNMIHAATPVVVFDFGGVLTKEPDRKAVNEFLINTFQFSTEKKEEVDQIRRQAFKAGINDLEFWLSYAMETGIELPEDWPNQFKETIKKAIATNPEMYALVDKLKAKEIPVALFSNIDSRVAAWIREFGLYAPFNPCILSCEINLQKPDPKAYEYLIQLLNTDPKQIIFIDDKLENIDGARAFGIDAIQFQSFEQLIEDLTERNLL